MKVRRRDAHWACRPHHRRRDGYAQKMVSGLFEQMSHAAEASKSTSTAAVPPDPGVNGTGYSCQGPKESRDPGVDKFGVRSYTLPRAPGDAITA